MENSIHFSDLSEASYSLGIHSQWRLSLSLLTNGNQRIDWATLDIFDNVQFVTEKVPEKLRERVNLLSDEEEHWPFRKSP